MGSSQPCIATVRRVLLDDEDLVEFIADYASERGDLDLESLCDDVLAGVTSEAILVDVVRNDVELDERVLAWRRS